MILQPIAIYFSLKNASKQTRPTFVAGSRAISVMSYTFLNRLYIFIFDIKYCPVFLVQLLLLIIILLSDVLLYTSFFAMPLNFALRYFAPEYGPIIPHPYVISAFLLISITTLVLFFASGMYNEKIGYANRYLESRAILHRQKMVILRKSVYFILQICSSCQSRSPLFQSLP